MFESENIPMPLYSLPLLLCDLSLLLRRILFSLSLILVIPFVPLHLWCCSLKHHQNCAKFLGHSEKIPPFFPLVKQLLFEGRMKVQEGFFLSVKLSKIDFWLAISLATFQIW